MQKHRCKKSDSHTKGVGIWLFGVLVRRLCRRWEVMLAPCCPQSLDSSSSHANTTWIFHAGGRVCWRLAARKALILRWVTPTWPRFFRLAGEYVGALLPAKPWFFVEPRQHDQDFSGRRGIMLAPCCSQSLNPSSSHANYVISFSWS